MKKWPEKRKPSKLLNGIEDIGWNKALDACADSLPTVDSMTEIIRPYIKELYKQLRKDLIFNDAEPTSKYIAQAIDRRIRDSKTIET